MAPLQSTALDLDRKPVELIAGLTHRFLGTLPEDGARSEVEWPGRQWLSGRLSSESSDQVGPASEDAYSAPSQPLHYYPSTTFSPVDFGKSPEHSEVWS